MCLYFLSLIGINKQVFSNFVLTNRLLVMEQKKKDNRGGYRANAGRKSWAHEVEAQKMSVEAIKKVYGSLEEGFIALLKTKREPLIKFVFEHAVGKPKETINLDTRVELTWIEE